MNDYSKAPVAMGRLRIVYGREDVRCRVEADAAGERSWELVVGGVDGDGADGELVLGEEPSGEVGIQDGSVDVMRIICLAGEANIYSEF